VPTRRCSHVSAGLRRGADGRSGGGGRDGDGGPGVLRTDEAYRFGDYWRFGLPLLALFFVVAVLRVPVVWRF
jgi:hypothetical protein